MNQFYLDTARLLTQVAPIVFADGVFALKGGTATCDSLYSLATNQLGRQISRCASE
jgi:hypothetical protein